MTVTRARIVSDGTEVLLETTVRKHHSDVITRSVKTIDIFRVENLFIPSKFVFWMDLHLLLAQIIVYLSLSGTMLWTIF